MKLVIATIACCFAVNAFAQAPGAAPATATPTAPTGEMGTNMTCGQMIASHAPMMEKMAAMAADMAAADEMHLKALDPKDKANKAEKDYLTADIKFHKEMSAKMKKQAEAAAKMKDAKMGKHDEKAMQDPKMMEAMMKMNTDMKEMGEMMTKHAADAEAMMHKSMGGGAK